MTTQDLRSKLEHGRQRFLAYALEHAFEIGRRTPLDFIRHFPPRTIMEALARRPDLRAGLLVPTTGLKSRIALKKTWQSAGEDLQTALDEGETQAQAVVDAFAPDDRVLYLPDKKLWAFLVEGQFWKITAKEDKPAFQMAQQHVAYLLDRALVDGLITARDVVDGIGVTELCNRLPRSEMATLFTAALDGGRKGAAFTDRDLLAALPPSTIVQHVPLPHIYETVIHARIATVHGYLEPPEEPKVEAAPAPVPAPAPPAEPAAEVKPAEEPAPEQTNGHGARKSRRPAAPGILVAGEETPANMEEDPEWIEIPESKH